MNKADDSPEEIRLDKEDCCDFFDLLIGDDTECYRINVTNDVKNTSIRHGDSLIVTRAITPTQNTLIAMKINGLVRIEAFDATKHIRIASGARPICATCNVEYWGVLKCVVKPPENCLT